MTREEIEKKDYLGDGAYVKFDGYHVVLTTEDGINITNTVALEPSVLAAFKRYIDRLEGMIEEYNTDKGN